MPKQRKDWQKMGFRSYQEYQQAVRKANINRIFEECLQEADDAHQATKRHRDRQLQDSRDREKYHNIRLQELAKCL